MADHKPNLDSLFEAAVEIETAAERAAFLDKSCGDDPELREQLERLLQSNEQAGSFLDKTPAALEATILTDGSGGNLAAALDAGLAPAFTKEQAVLLGDGRHSVLKMLGQTLDQVPRVALRDSVKEGADPVVRPKSAEMPKQDADSRYRLDGEIARGGMGAILKGRDTDLGRDLAIKVLLDQHKDRPEVVQRFVEEAQIGGQLQHPGIAPVYELGQFKDKRPFFSMKLVKGETLSKLLGDRKDLAAERGKFVGIFEQICQTMAYAHSRGVIHRDLKPANIMVGAFGEVQVMDWGLAKVLQSGGIADEKKAKDKQQGQSIIRTLRSKVGSDAPGTLGTVGSIGSMGSQTQMGSVMGTPAYMPPEQALGEIDLMDERADVFGLGAILCEILTGQPPYVGSDGTQVYRMASRGKLADCFARLDASGAECNPKRERGSDSSPKRERGTVNQERGAETSGATAGHSLADASGYMAQTAPVDAELIAIAKHCLEIDPQDRPRDAGVLAERVTSYLTSVESRLRQAEVERATEAARAEEALQTAKEHELAARHERRARKLQMGLAVVVLCVLTVGGIAATWTAAVQSRLKNDAQLAEQKANKAREEEAAQRQLAQQQQTRAEMEQARAEGQTRRAEEEQRNAEQQRDLNRRNLYFAQMQLAQQSWGLVNGMHRMRSFLDPWQPQPSLTDLRGWEWSYLNSLQHTEEFLIDAHRGNVRACAWSVDGKFLASGGDDLVIHVSASDGQVLQSLKGHTGRITSLSWHPDASRLASASDDQTVRIWNPVSGECLSTLSEHGEPTLAVAWSHDGKRIASGSREKIVVWNAETREVARSLNSSGESLAWLPDDTQLVLQGQQATSVWTMASNEPPRQVCRDRDQFRPALAVSPDGRLVATPNQSDVCVRELGTGKIVRTISGHKLPPLSLSFSPDGRQLASAGGEASVSVWDLATGAEINIFRGQLGGISSLSWHPDGRRLASASNDVRIWNTNQFNGDLEIRTSNERTMCVVWSPDGLCVATAGQGGQLEIRDTESGELLRSMPAHPGWTEGLAWHPHQPWLASSGNNNQLRIWNPDTGALLREFTHITRLRSIDWSPDGKWLAVCGQAPDGEVLLLDSETWEITSKLSESESLVRGVKWNHDGTKIAAVSYDHVVRVWDTATQQLLGKFPGAVTLAWSNRGDRLATSMGGSVTIWDTTKWEKTAELQGHTSLIYSLGWNADDTRLVSASHDSTAIVWDTTSDVSRKALAAGSGLAQDPRLAPGGSQVLTLRQGRDQLHTAAWDPAFQRIATVDSKGFLHLLDSRPRFGLAVAGPNMSQGSSSRQALDKAAATLATAFDNATPTERRLLIARASRLRVLERLQALRPKSPQLLIALALQLKNDRSGVRQNMAEVSNATTADKAAALRGQVLELLRGQGADSAELPLVSIGHLAQLLIEDDPRGTWSLLEPTETTASTDVVLTREPTGFVLSGRGESQPATYSVQSRPEVKRITALRLDVSPHASLSGGSGHGGGNFHLTEVRARVRHGDGSETPLKFRNAVSDYVRPLDHGTTLSDGPWSVLDGLEATHWDVHPNAKQPHWLVLDCDTPVPVGESDTLIVELDSGDANFPHARLGHFRLSVSEEPRPGIAQSLAAAVRTDDLPPVERLAAACLINGEAAIARDVLNRAPQPDSREPLLRALLRATAQQQLGQHELAQQTAKAAVPESPLAPWPHSLTGFYLQSLRDFAGLSHDEIVKLRASRDSELALPELERELARLARLIEAKPTDAKNLEARANSLMRLGRWREAADDWAAVRKLTPNTRSKWFSEANCRLLAGDEAAYKQLCQDMVQQFRGTTDAQIADSIIKTCLLSPGTIDPSELPTQLLHDVLKDPTKVSFHPWFVGSAALSSYRAGKYDEALAWAKKHPDNKSQSGALALTVRAMAEHQLGQHEEARKSLDQAEAEIPKSLRPSSTPAPQPQRPTPAADIAPDWLAPELLRREAAKLMK